MRALSIRQPWAWAIVNGFKPVENRTWKTNFRGPVLIHAGQKVEASTIDFVTSLAAAQIGSCDLDVRSGYRIEEATGAIVGIARLAYCVTSLQSDWFTGPYGFVLKDAQPIQPVPCKGALGFFTPPREVLEAVERQLGEAG